MTKKLTALEMPDGPYVKVADIKDAVDPVIQAAREVELYGAPVARLQKLGQALDRMEEFEPARMVPGNEADTLPDDWYGRQR